MGGGREEAKNGIAAKMHANCADTRECTRFKQDLNKEEERKQERRRRRILGTGKRQKKKKRRQSSCGMRGSSLKRTVPC